MAHEAFGIWCQSIGMREPWDIDEQPLEFLLPTGDRIGLRVAPGACANDYLLYAARPIGYDTFAAVHRSLLQVHPELGGLWEAQTAVHCVGSVSNCVLSLRMRQQDATDTKLYQYFEHLMDWLRATQRD
jgi:hypothetical protein